MIAERPFFPVLAVKMQNCLFFSSFPETDLLPHFLLCVDLSTKLSFFVLPLLQPFPAFFPFHLVQSLSSAIQVSKEVSALA